MIVGGIQFFIDYLGSSLFCYLLARGCTQLSSLHGLFYVSAHISVCFFKTIKKRVSSKMAVMVYVMYHVLLVTCAVFCWLEVSLRSCPHSRAEDLSLIMGQLQSLFAKPPYFKDEETGPEGWLGFRRYSCLVEELRVDAPPFNFKPVLEPESGSVKLSMLLNFLLSLSFLNF